MSTQIPPASKRARRQAQEAQQTSKLVDPVLANFPNVRIKLQAQENGETINNLRVPGTSTVQQLELLVNKLLNSEENVPYEFVCNGKPIHNDLFTDIFKPELQSPEDEILIEYSPRAVFRVRNITRSSGVALGHGATILSAQFAPDTATRAVTGAGDCTARIWSSDSGTPIKCLQGHADHVLCAKYSPCGRYIASASRDGTIGVWDALSGDAVGKLIRAHSAYITDICWEPLHLANPTIGCRLVSGSKDKTAKLWDVLSGHCLYTFSHTNTVSCVKWGGFNDVYTASHDKTVKVWDASSGRMKRSLDAHAHWVNHIALSTDFALRSGAYGPTLKLDIPTPKGPSTHNAVDQARFKELQKIASQKFEQALSHNKRELVATASDDFTMYLWDMKQTKPLARLTGHQQLVNHVCFSPDGRYLASSSFDRSVKLWEAQTGKFIASLRGHVAAVYQSAWSADSRLLVSCSKDTTLKVWDIATRKLKSDLPGHKDEVYAVDWSVDGTKVVSGSRDKTVRFWTY
ncbi:Rsa4 protein [Starmerella bacillaris]|uniref:Rsa4 protein n=1 Tax=Starmerella bacillaris TaxID=1247836 RepID=A0AAV5RNF4_STABA|nr:Rsa4 protein [Starmerella bacillaris]